MIELRVLGGLDLRGPDGGELESILHQPKRLALLAYLAVAFPRGFHRRDTLLGLFWPELDQQHAQNALAQAVHVLRRAVGAGVVLSRGPSELGLETTRLWCDACAFEQALEAGRAGEALELYRGDLLRGLFLSGTLEFERWLEAERARLREQASAVAWRLSDAEERAGRPGTAVHWGRRALALAPDDEGALRRLLSLLERVGDRAGALRAYEQFSGRLTAEYESQPSPQTQELIQGISGRSAPPRDRAHPPDLPPEHGPLIGRERELARLRNHLLRDEVRLLTLTGPGGVGKTRLAVAVTADLLEQFADGSYFVALGALGTVGQVVLAIARSLDVRETGNGQLLDSLKTALQRRALLLVLDNFEHVLEARSVVGELLAASPLLKVLVTSREPLRLPEEHALPVPPLALPQLEHLLSLELLSTYPALELFAERAQAVVQEFALTEANVTAVAEICARVEGLPLAIELAAARVKGLPPQAILARLESPLSFLRLRTRDLAPRHQSLRRTIAWSYELLDPGEKTLCRGLAVFAGGCTPAAAEAVCGVAGDLGLGVQEGLSSLVEKSLLRRGVAKAGGDPRLGMLETIREYAWERLVESGEVDALRRRHAEHYLALAEAAEPELTGPRQETWLELLDAEHDNLRTALSWSEEGGELELGLRLAGALWRFWSVRGFPSEGRAWLEELLALSEASGQDPAAVSVCANAFYAAGSLALDQCDYSRGVALLERALALYRDSGDRTGTASSLNNLGISAMHQGDFHRATALFEQSLEIRRELGDKLGVSASRTNLATTVFSLGDYARAAAIYEEALPLKREMGDRSGLALALNNLGCAIMHCGDWMRAQALLEDSLELRRELGDKDGIGMSLHSLGDLAVEQDDLEGAASLYGHSLEAFEEVGDQRSVAFCLEGSAKVACGRRDFARAAQLLGAAEALRRRIAAPLWPADSADLDAKLAAARVGLGEVAFTSASAEGRAMMLDQAVALMRDVLDAPNASA